MLFIMTLLVGFFIGSTTTLTIALIFVKDGIDEEYLEEVRMQAAYDQLQIDTIHNH